MALQVCRLACARGERRLFSDVSFTLQGGDALWIKGGNGSGKTSLLRLLCGLGVPDTGEVLWHGRAIGRLREDFHRDLLYCGHAGAVKDDLFAWENLAIGSTLAGRPCTRDAALRALDQAGLGRAAGLPARVLSQGQRRRVTLARLYLAPLPRLLLLDEPFAALDHTAVQSLCGVLAQHLGQDGIVVYTTHQPYALRAGRLLQLDLQAGPPAWVEQDHAPAQPC